MYVHTNLSNHTNRSSPRLRNVYVPGLCYHTFVYSPTENLVGYIDSSLSEFNTSDYRDDMKSDVDDEHPETCQYRGYRNGPDDSIEPYGLSPQYWHVFAARLAFVVVFEHVVSQQTRSFIKDNKLTVSMKRNFFYRFLHLPVL